jgi:hypothetical protein
LKLLQDARATTARQGRARQTRRKNEENMGSATARGGMGESLFCFDTRLGFAPCGPFVIE